jgi:uncharacterized protein (UPF0371 family)
MEFCYNNTKTKHYQTVETFPKYNRKIDETGVKSIIRTPIYMTTNFSGLG